MKRLTIFAMVALCGYTGALFSFSTTATGIRLQLRKRVQPGPGGAWQPITMDKTIQPSQTAIVICDMWDRHWCDGATNRVEKLARKMEPVLDRARAPVSRERPGCGAAKEPDSGNQAAATD